MHVQTSNNTAISVFVEANTLLGANYTVKFLVRVIWWAGKMAVVTLSFDVIEQGTISISHTIT
jgi:hypothetical protein